MQEKLEKWKELAARAAEDQDPDKPRELVREINHLLAEKQDRLKPYPRPFQAFGIVPEGSGNDHCNCPLMDYAFRLMALGLVNCTF